MRTKRIFVLHRLAHDRSWVNLKLWCLIACLTLSCSGSGYKFVTRLQTMAYDWSVIKEQCGNLSDFPMYQSDLRNGVLYATPSMILSAFDLKRRSYLWHLKDPEFCVREFALVGDKIVVVQTRKPPRSERILYHNEWSLDYFVATVDTNSGVVVWRTELPSDVIGASLAVRSDSVYLAGHAPWSELKRDGPRGWIEVPRVYAIDLETGSIRWTSLLEPYHEKDEQIGRATLMPDETGVLVHKNSIRGRRDVEIFDSRTGERRWAISAIPRSGKGKPTPHSWLGPVADGKFSVFRGKTMDLYSLRTGEKVDSIEGEWQDYFAEMRFDRQTMYQYSEGVLRAFDLTTGKTLWVRELGIERNWKGGTNGHCPMDIQEDVISIGADDGFIYLVNAQDGSIRARTGYGGVHRSSPAYLFGNGVIVHDSTTIVSMRPHTIWERWNPFF